MRVDSAVSHQQTIYIYFVYIRYEVYTRLYIYRHNSLHKFNFSVRALAERRKQTYIPGMHVVRMRGTLLPCILTLRVRHGEETTGGDNRRPASWMGGVDAVDGAKEPTWPSNGLLLPSFDVGDCFSTYPPCGGRRDEPA